MLRNLKAILVVGGITVGILTSAFADGAAAQGAMTGALTPEQSRNLYGPPAPQPGIYKIRNRASGFCLQPKYGYPNPAFFSQNTCEAPGSAFDTYAIMPHPAGGFTIRHGQVIQERHFIYCATVARGVILGPNRIDQLPCSDTDATGVQRRGFGPTWNSAGTEDQRFYFEPGPGNVFRIRTRIGAKDECWGVRGDSVDRDADVIRWECNNLRGQQFELIPVDRQWPENVEADAMNAQGWFWSVPRDAARWEGWRRNVPVMGVDLPGNDWQPAEAENDNGAICALKCTRQSSCKSWTWTARGVDGHATPMCWLKNANGQPVNKGLDNFKYFSGIIRP